MYIPYAVGKEYPPIILINRMMRGYPYREGNGHSDRRTDWLCR